MISMAAPRGLLRGLTKGSQCQYCRSGLEVLPRMRPTSSCRTILGPRYLSSAAGPSSGTNSNSPSWFQSNTRVSTLFGVLVVIGIGSTAFGLYEFYSAFTMWPKPIREDLRAGVKAKNQGNLNTSERFLTRTLETALEFPLDELAPNPHLKTSGIAITLGQVLEMNNKPEKAYEVYVAALERLQQASQSKGKTDKGLSGPERVRAAALAYKLGEMAEEYSQPAEEEEKHLVYAVEELLRVLRDAQSQKGSGWFSLSDGDTSGKQKSDADANERLILEELDLPRWVSRDDVVAPLESLGAFYNRVGKQEYAVPLYLSALSILLPPNSHQASPLAKCQGAHIMNSLASSLAQTEPTPERRTQAETWVKKAIAVINTVKSSSQEQDPEVLQQCDTVLAAALFNMGSLREMAGAQSEAREWYASSRNHAISVKMREGVLEADVALRRVNRVQKTD